MSIPPIAPFGPLLTAMVTPFHPDGKVNFERAEELALRLLESGSSGLIVSGTTGESPTLTPDEKLELYRRVKIVAKDAPVIANTGDNETAFSVEFSKMAVQTGVNGLLLVVPYYNKPSQEGLFRHFKTIAESVELPCLLYNVPGRTGRNMTAQTHARLSLVENIIGTKEASGDLVQIGHIRAQTDENFAIYSGDDAATLPMLPLGCCGCISVVSHIAGKPFRAMMDAFWSGDMKTARDLHLRLLPVIEALFPANGASPAPVKTALALQGFPCGGLRLPLVESDADEIETMKRVLATAGLL
ncbi:dihydrodipicolinate synthase [Abditibacterium utsteinense]|uniref:4-hydroxy-tetrahydrodipicolinate synthase n=1 Tax=Abditibacterium utsteinense TaxID=1960156 RepID=A0A2S8SSW1_9BACT|nr:4-hydroxy-tetrahydrodipicolinate synthase [Abditibacterium utsteinense]PQV63829.1 dihydrodipicolinate synthase [Abditibacterium utsteinense]